MKKTKSSISDLVIALQDENDDLRFLYKLFEKACLKTFKYDIPTIKIMLEKQRIYEEKRAERNAQKPHIDLPSSQSMSGSNEGERKADHVLDLDKKSAGFSDGGYSPISI